MNDLIRLGRIGGVRVGLHWSVLVIFFLLVAGLGAGRFPVVLPGRSAAEYWVAGIVAGLVFLGSLLAHEMAHAVVARRNGLTVEGITLWLLGGVARIRGEAPDPRAELRIAGIGPLVSLVLGLAFGILGFLVSALGVTGLTIGVLAWLAGINVLLAIFNSIPAAPLDGGRLLRAFLWSRHGDRLRAAVSAARVGRVFGYVLVALGLASFLMGGGFGGLWITLIGIFLVGAATAEEQAATAQGQLRGLAVRDVMSARPVVVPQDVSAADLLDRYVFAHRFSTFPTVDVTGRTVGLVTLNRVKQIPAAQRARVRVRDIACPLTEVPSADPDEPLNDLLPRMGGCADGRALVLRDGHLIGVVSPSDIMRALEHARLRSEVVGPRSS